MKTTAFLLMMLVPAVVSAQQKPTTGYAPVNGLKMYYEIHGSGEPVVLLHGAFMAIAGDWNDWINELSKTRKVIAVEMQGHGRTADIKRDLTFENLADDVAALLDYLKIPSADIIGYSLGGGVAMQCAIRHPEKVRKVVSISAVIRRDGWVQEGVDALAQITAEAFKGTPIEAEYKKLSPTPNDFPDFVKHVIAMASKPYDFGADNLRATKAPMFFIHGDADGVRLDHIAEMYRLKGGELHGDMRPHPESRLAILPNTTHVTLMNRWQTIVPMVNDFLDGAIRVVSCDFVDHLFSRCKNQRSTKSHEQHEGHCIVIAGDANELLSLIPGRRRSVHPALVRGISRFPASGRESNGVAGRLQLARLAQVGE